MFCGRCGAQLAEDAQFCTACGAPVTPEQPAQSNRPEQPRILGRHPRRAFAVLALIVLVLLVAVVVLLIPEGGSAADHPAFLYTTSRGDVYLCTTPGEDSGVLLAEDVSRCDGLIFSSNGKYFCCRMDATLYVQSVKCAGKKNPVEISDDETARPLAVMEDGSVYYLRGDAPSYSLYCFDGQTSTRLLSRITDYETVDETGTYFYYARGENADRLCRIALRPDGEEELMIKGDYAVLSDYGTGELLLGSRVYDASDLLRDLYRAKPGSEPECIVRDAYQVFADATEDPIRNGFYYTTMDSDLVWLSDVVVDSLEEADAALTEPDYEDFTRTRGDERLTDWDAYHQAVQAYEQAQSRMALRSQLREQRVEMKIYALYFWKNGKSTLVADHLSGVNARDDGKLIFCKISPYYQPSAPLDQMQSVDEVLRELTDPQYGEMYLYSDGKEYVLSEPMRGNDIGYVCHVDAELCFRTVADDDTGLLWAVSTRQTAAQAEMLSERVRYYTVVDGQLYYLAEQEDQSLNLFCYSGGETVQLLENVQVLYGACTDEEYLNCYAVVRRQKDVEIFCLDGTQTVALDLTSFRACPTAQPDGSLLQRDENDRLYYLSGATLTRISRNAAAITGQITGVPKAYSWYWSN